ncbi:MAG: pentapeptide repeat-containing protein [Pseudomonadota bacterium]
MCRGRRPADQAAARRGRAARLDRVSTWPAGCGWRYADLRDADLHDADLHDADPKDADLHDADPKDADLNDAYLNGPGGAAGLSRPQHGRNAIGAA